MDVFTALYPIKKGRKQRIINYALLIRKWLIAAIPLEPDNLCIIINALYNLIGHYGIQVY